MKRTLRSVLALMLVSAPVVASLGGCATGGSAAAPSGEPIELDGTKWKLVALGGVLDGRVIEFKKRGQDGYEATLVEPGRRLRDAVGVRPGEVIFKLRRKSPNEYEGMYKAIDSSGNSTEREVVVFTSGGTLSWNQESAVWEKM